MVDSVQVTLTGKSVRPYTDARLLRELYEDCGYSLRAIAELLDCDHTTVHYYVQRFGIKRRESGDRAGSRSVPFCTRTDGYECWRVDHRAILVHRLLAIAEWGYETVADGIVHHDNAIRWDNRPSNLTHFDSQGAHSRHHARPEISDDQQSLAEITTFTRHPENVNNYEQSTLDDF